VITVLMPVYNGAEFVEEAIRSILNQTFSRFELLIIDDASTDDTGFRIRQFSDPRIRYFRLESHQGIRYCLNLGLARARYPLVARQDADDRSHPQRLEYQWRFLQSHPDYLIVGSHGFRVNRTGTRLGYLFKPVDAQSLRWIQCFESPFIHTSVMFRRQPVVDRFGGYPECHHCEDIALWSRLLLQGPAANLPLPLIDYRVHEQSTIRQIAADSIEALFEKQVLPVLHHYVRCLLKEAFPRDCVRILAAVPRGIRVANAKRFWDCYLELLERFVAGHPQALTSAAFQETLLYQMLGLMRRVPGRPPLKMIRRFGQWILQHPVRAFQVFSWKKGFFLSRPSLESTRSKMV